MPATGPTGQRCSQCGDQLWSAFEVEEGRCGRCWSKGNVQADDTKKASPPKKALHFSEGKAGLDQLPAEVLVEWARVFDYGAEKYARDNWKLGTDWHQFYGSALRHITRWWMGENIDPETGLHHLAHALWNIATLRYYQIHNLGIDDRPEPPDKERLIVTYNQPPKRKEGS